MGHEEGQKLYSDTALNDIEADQLGYGTFAEHLADTICGWTPDEEFVIGIYGQWGSGKSSILNFVESEIESREEQPVIVRFNPWWFSGQADLIEKFFSQLRTGLGDDEKFSDAKEKLADLSRTVSKVPFYKLTGVPAGPFLGRFADMISIEEENIGKLKDEISELLTGIDQPIVVFIDDIDRLTDEEIKQMFRLVKSVADFPNLIYVLAFDRDIITEALETGERGVQNGDEYLEKIIQLPQHVPIPREGSLDQFFTDRLDAIVGDDEIVFDSSHWQTVYKEGIEPLVQTPRDAIRLSNAVKTSYGALQNEINYLDLIAVEALRIYFNSLYDQVRTNKSKFTNRRQMERSNSPDYSFLWENFDGDHKDSATMLLSYLFPRFEEDDFAMGRTISENSNTYRKRNRICHPEMFSYYFRQTVPEGQIPIDEFQSIVKSTENPEKFEKHLMELSDQRRDSGRSEAHNFLKRFEEHAAEVGNKKGATKVLFRLSDHLIEVDPPANQFNDGNRGHIYRAVHNMLENTADPGPILEDAIRRDGSTYFTTHFLIRCLQEHGEHGGNTKREENRLLSMDTINSLKQVWVEQVEGKAESNKLSEQPHHLDRVLDTWIEWGDQEEAVEWSQSYASDDESLVDLVDSFLREGRSSAIGRFYYIDPEWLEPFIDIEEAEKRLQSIDKNRLDEDERKAVEKFLRGRELREAGEDPSSLEAWTFSKRKNMNK
ncbi:KAP family P-loop NTPase fold protein [Haloarcula rubripromontorii]|uniref:KAP family P-loop NTPase fold protein n=1 Tax=Haloarcula rubripromontorii TaxID=1705562 RepID=UPI00345C5D20